MDLISNTAARATGRHKAVSENLLKIQRWEVNTTRKSNTRGSKGRVWPSRVWPSDGTGGVT